MKADKLLINGKIYTGLSQKAYDYLAVSAHRISGIGRGAGKEHRGRKTEVIDLRGMVVVPGIIDSHLHLLDYSLSLSRVNLESCSSQTDVQRILTERSQRTTGDEWVLGRGWTQAQFGGMPHKKILDEIFHSNPVVLESHDGHVRWLNSRAIEAAKLAEAEAVEGGLIGKDADGSPNGILAENAVALIRNVIPKPDATTRKLALLQAQRKLHEYGIVGLHSLDAEDAFSDLQELHDESKLRLRVFHSIPLRNLEHAIGISLKSGFGDSWLQFGFVKIFSDGTLGAQTASMLEPFEETGGLGIDTINEQQLTEKIGLALENGIAVGVHAIGDRASRQTLNAFEKSFQWMKTPRARSRVEHAQLLHPKELVRFRKLGVLASMQPYHAISDHELAIRYWGNRSTFSYPWRSLLNAGATLIFGSDAPIEEPDPLLGLRAAVHRANWEDKTQTISPYQALLAYTWNAAYASGEEKERGSLEPGKLADFVVFSDDPYQTAFNGIKVKGTAIDGAFVYNEIEA
jgi:predicted amidohydrolase YtcJ